MRAYLQLIRHANCSMAGLAAAIGVFIAYNIVNNNIDAASIPIPFLETALVFLTVFFVTGAGNAINDYFDVEIDAINKPSRPIPSGKIGLQNALYFSLVLFVIGTITAFAINLVCGFIALFNSLLLIYYAKTLKRTALFGNLSVGYLTGSTFLFGGAVFFENGGIEAVAILFILSTMATISREIVKDIEDMEGDAKDGASTLPIKIGARKSAYFAAMIGIVAVLASPVPYLQSMLSMRYLYIVAIADIFFAFAVFEILKRNNAAKSSSLFKKAMMFALLSFIIGA